MHYKDNKVITPFGRQIQCENHYALNYLVQSTAADILFEQMHKVWKFLESKKTFISFCNHDSIMIDLSEDDQYVVNDIKEIFSETRLGKFKVNCLGGKNWSALGKLNIK